MASIKWFVALDNNDKIISQFDFYTESKKGGMNCFIESLTDKQMKEIMTIKVVDKKVIKQ